MKRAKEVLGTRLSRGGDMLDTWRTFIKRMHIGEKKKLSFSDIIGSKMIIYFILICAYFHNILRFPGDSSITLFRLLMPLSLYLIFRYSRKVFWTLVCAGGGLIVLNLLQFVLTCKVFYPEIAFSLSNMIVYWIHILSIFIFIGLIVCLKMAEKMRFVSHYFLFNQILIKISILCDIVFLLSGGASADFALFGNINDFGCAMVAGMAIILCGKERWWSKCFWSGCIFVLLYINDSKLALLGALLEVLIFGIVRMNYCIVRAGKKHLVGEAEFSSENKNHRQIKKSILAYWRLLIIPALVLTIAIVLMSPIHINGYSVRQMVVNALSQVLSGEFYKRSNESLLFRVNAIIGMGKILKESYFCGVGSGNTGMILRAILPGMEEMFPNRIYVSPHVWWLELFADCGFILIIPSILLFVYQIKRFFIDQHNDGYSMLQTMTLLSFPVWCMSASGLYTEYYTLSLMIVAILGATGKLFQSFRERKKHVEYELHCGK